MPIIAIVLLAAMLTVIFFDATRFIIPNWLNAALLALYPVAVLLSPEHVNWQADLLGFLGAFAVGYFIFMFRIMGGGDVKLIIVLALWVGVANLAKFTFFFAMLGGALTILLLILRAIMPAIIKNTEKLPRALKKRKPVPYGLAIAGAFLILLFNGEIPAAGYHPQLPARQPAAPEAPQSDSSALPQK